MAWGEVDSWDDVKLKDLGKLLEGFDKKDISMLIDDTVKVSTLFSTSGNVTQISACCTSAIKLNEV
jgi:hypothetical protein